MASIHRRSGSRFYYCSFKDATGRQRFVSTKCEDRVRALEMAARLEAVSGRDLTNPHLQPIPTDRIGELTEAGLSLLQAAKAGRLTPEMGRQWVDRLLQAVGQEATPAESVRAYAENWLAGVKLSRSPKTSLRYEGVIRSLLASLGDRAAAPISSLTARDIERWRDSLLKMVVSSTTALNLKIVRVMLNQARRQGLIAVNPAEAVDLPRQRSRSREVFSTSEIEVLIQAAPSREWKTLILLGAYAGLRLGDASRLKWEDIDLAGGVIKFKAGKTGRAETVPLHPTLLEQLNRVAGDSGGLVCPTLGTRSLAGTVGLSSQFVEILRGAGLDSRQDETKPKGKRRRFTARSFHALRHTYVSALANSGVDRELRMKLAGHTTEDAHATYTHTELQTLRGAINRIPGIKL